MKLIMGFNLLSYSHCTLMKNLYDVKYPIVMWNALMCTPLRNYQQT